MRIGVKFTSRSTEGEGHRRLGFCFNPYTGLGKGLKCPVVFWQYVYLGSHSIYSNARLVESASLCDYPITVRKSFEL